jgi:hypothetical protein
MERQVEVGSESTDVRKDVARAIDDLKKRYEIVDRIRKAA